MQAVFPFVPPPYNTLVGYALMLGTGLFRSRIQKQKGINMAKSFEKLKTLGGLILTPQQKDILNAEQTPGTKALVDEAQGKTTGLPV